MPVWASYDFIRYPLLRYTIPWPSVGGVYLFVAEDQTRRRLVYVGSTKNLGARCRYHEHWYEGKRCGASHIHFRKEPVEEKRRALERVLIAVFEPQLNTHYRGWPVGDYSRWLATYLSYEG